MAAIRRAFTAIAQGLGSSATLATDLPSFETTGGKASSGAGVNHGAGRAAQPPRVGHQRPDAGPRHRTRRALRLPCRRLPLRHHRRTAERVTGRIQQQPANSANSAGSAQSRDTPTSRTSGSAVSQPRQRIYSQRLLPLFVAPTEGLPIPPPEGSTRSVSPTTWVVT